MHELAREAGALGRLDGAGLEAVRPGVELGLAVHRGVPDVDEHAAAR